MENVRFMNNLEQKKAAFADLIEIIETLREKCPWDKKQTLESLRSLTIEEVYELGDAILAKDMQEVKKELGGFDYAPCILCPLGRRAGGV